MCSASTPERNQELHREYVFARPSFHEDGQIHAFHMEIISDRDASVQMANEVPVGKKVPLRFGNIDLPRAASPVHSRQ